jgi:hypothetical protein
MPNTTAATTAATAGAGAAAAATAASGTGSSGGSSSCSAKAANSSSSGSSSSNRTNSQQQQEQQPTAVVGAQVQRSASEKQLVQQSEVPQWLRSSYDDATGGSSSGKKRGRDSNVQAVEERARQCLAKARPHFPQ